MPLPENKTQAAIQILVGARKLIEKREGWTRGVYARDSLGFQVNPDNRVDAVCFCGHGAVGRACRDLQVGAGDHMWAMFTAGQFVALETLDEVSDRRGFSTFPRFNDAPGTTHDDVLEAFDEAIALLEASQ